MTQILQRLGIDRMSAAERLTLAQDIIQSVVVEQPRTPLSEEKLQELDRRVADHIANPSEVVSWEEVEAAALARRRR